MRVQKVQKVHRVHKGKVGGCAASLDKTFITGLRPMENRQIALVGEGKHANRPAGVGNAPLFPLRGTSPGGGSFSGSSP